MSPGLSSLLATTLVDRRLPAAPAEHESDGAADLGVGLVNALDEDPPVVEGTAHRHVAGQQDRHSAAGLNGELGVFSLNSLMPAISNGNVTVARACAAPTRNWANGTIRPVCMKNRGPAIVV